MRLWTRGELQAISAASRFLTFLGLSLAGFGVLILVLEWKVFVATLPGSLISERLLLIVGGVVLVVAGRRLSKFVRKYERETGVSSVPFPETESGP